MSDTVHEAGVDAGFAPMPYKQKKMSEPTKGRYRVYLKDGGYAIVVARSALEAYKIYENKNDVLRIQRDMFHQVSLINKGKLGEGEAVDMDLPTFAANIHVVGLGALEDIGIEVGSIGTPMGDDAIIDDSYVPQVVDTVVEAAASVNEEKPVSAAPTHEEVSLASPQEAVVVAAEPAKEVPSASPSSEDEGLSAGEIERLLNG